MFVFFYLITYKLSIVFYEYFIYIFNYYYNCKKSERYITLVLYVFIFFNNFVSRDKKFSMISVSPTYLNQILININPE